MYNQQQMWGGGGGNMGGGQNYGGGPMMPPPMPTMPPMGNNNMGGGNMMNNNMGGGNMGGGNMNNMGGGNMGNMNHGNMNNTGGGNNMGNMGGNMGHNMPPPPMGNNMGGGNMGNNMGNNMNNMGGGNMGNNMHMGGNNMNNMGGGNMGNNKMNNMGGNNMNNNMGGNMNNMNNNMNMLGNMNNMNGGMDECAPQVLPSQKIMNKMTVAAQKANSSKLPNGKEVKLVDTLEECRKSVTELLSESEVGCYFESAWPPTQNNDGQIYLINIADSEEQVYIFDIVKLGGEKAFNAGGLRMLLESTQVEKIVFDGRCDNDALYNLYGFSMEAVYDLQVLYTLNFSYELHAENARKMEYMQRQNWGQMQVPFEPSNLEENPRFLKGYQFYLDMAMVIPPEMQDEVDEIQTRGLATFTAAEDGLGLENRVWEIRPLPQLLKNYIGVNVGYMYAMKNKWTRSHDLDDVVVQLSKKRVQDAMTAEEATYSVGGETGRRDIPLLDGKYYLNVLATTDAVDADPVRQRHEECMNNKTNNDLERQREKEAKMNRKGGKKGRKGKGKGRGGSKGGGKGKGGGSKGGGKGKGGGNRQQGGGGHNNYGGGHNNYGGGYGKGQY